MKTKLSFALLLISFLSPVVARLESADLFDKSNLAAWCIVPFDAAKRTPEARAEMVAKMGIGKIAYDWRAENIPEFEREILAYQKHGIEFFAFWGQQEEAFQLFEKYKLSPQLWVMIKEPDVAQSVAQGVTQGVTQLMLSSNMPVAFGVLTTENLQQAIDRAGGKYGNKGDEAAMAAIRMVALQIEMAPDGSEDDCRTGN